MTVAALGTGIVLIFFFALIVILIGIDQLLWSMSVPLLEVETTCIAQRLQSGRFSSPEWGRGCVTVRTLLPTCRGGGIETGSTGGRRRDAVFGRVFSGGGRWGRRR
jgi:hypothetical protein